MEYPEGCRFLCGMCSKEIGDQPLREHFDSGDCGFIEATYHPLHFLHPPLKDEPTIDWMSE